ncbi:unsaturated chondroitin disaccharide hydrolase [Pseudomonas flavescens]|uniref:Unsaturated chondroitin disaccharide hydrolase n=1 Tax=Phytopseudomonas flavescens TaxID=29435 RepID=A0A1G8EEM4_9GAMM|nr:glucuronyl hydrolase [Pseudomonas flavescens]SDH68311.1 unsaturated chondroitin disaccharide hydrolase [Pseudomonas flavescens]
MTTPSHAQAPLQALEAERAIDQMLARLDLIQAACGEAFPLYCRGVGQPWKASCGGSWLGGFWAGLWWLRAYGQGDRQDQQQAERIARRLADKLDDDTHHRSLIFWYGAGLGARLLDNQPSAALARQARQRLALAFDPLLGAIPLGRDMGGGEHGARCLSIDPLAATLRLFALDAEPHLLNLGRQQLQGSLHACAGADGAWSSHARFVQGRWQPGDAPGNWSRGQAWAMLGLEVGAALYGEPYGACAERAADYWLLSRAHAGPLNRLDQPHAADDPCAAAMASLALLGRSVTAANGGALRMQAGAQLAAIIRGGDFHDGCFVGHCYRTAATVEQKVETACGSFFLLAALLAWSGKIDPAWL